MKGYVKFEKALDKIEALFKNPEFKGEFRMKTYGHHDGNHEPTERNYCGTSACLAGWLSIVDPGFGKEVGAEWDEEGYLKETSSSFERSAAKYYGFSITDTWNLFMHDLELSGAEGLKVKLSEARRIAEKARKADK